MPRPKGYKLSEEAKKRIGDASRKKWEEKRIKTAVPSEASGTSFPFSEQSKKPWWRFWE